MPWDREFLADNLAKTFLTGELRKHREQILFEREQSLLPATQIYVEIRKLCKEAEAKLNEFRKKQDEFYGSKQYNKYLEEFKNKNMEEAKIRTDLVKKIEKLPLATKRNPENYLEYTSQMAEIQQKYNNIIKTKHADIITKQNEFVKEHRLLNKTLRRYTRAYNSNNPEAIHGTDTPVERKKFIRACPTDNCKGFLSSQWHCTLCQCWVCPDCHELKESQDDVLHTCKPENVETAKLLAKDTKPCPNCAAQIFKIVGCDQMFCTACNTPFSWVKGTVITSGHVHNPHYFEWMKNNKPGGIGRSAGDIPCGDVPHYNEFWQAYHEMSEEFNNLPEIFRIITHIRFDIIDRLPSQNLLPEENREHRVNYMMNEIDETTFKQRIQHVEKTREKKLALRLVYEMGVTASCDILRGIIDPTTRSMRSPKEWMDDFTGLRVYINECLIKIAKTYNSGVQIINKTVDGAWILEYYKVSTVKRIVKSKEADASPTAIGGTAAAENEFVALV
jgi:hypothetical protein